MATTTTNLSFATLQPQGLWAPGLPVDLSIDTGDLLVFSTNQSVPIDLDIAIFAFEAELYTDLRLGLLAYAGLGETGGFEASFDFAVEVTHPSFEIINTAGETMTFDFEVVDIGQSTLQSTSFDGSASAGLDLIVDIEAGIRDISFWLPFVGTTEVPDVTLIDVDEEIPLIEVTPETLGLSGDGLSFEPISGITLSARLPTGADTFGTSVGSTVVTSEGASDTRFLELEADLDQLLVDMLKKVPLGPVQAAAAVLENVVFASIEFDINDYIPGIPSDLFTLDATVLDVTAGVGTVITEDLSLDVGNGDTTPDINITLVSDNGTPDFIADDVIVTDARVGESVDIPTPFRFNPATNSAFPNLIGAPATVTATYSIDRARYSHDVGIGLNASLNITALQAAVGGKVGNLLGISFGPLLDVEFPDGGLNIDLFDFYSDSFDIAGNAFNDQVATYEVFFSSIEPQGGLDPNDPASLHELIAFVESTHENQDALLEDQADLIDGRATNFIETFINANNVQGVFNDTSISNRVVVWQALTSTISEIRMGEDQNNDILIAPVDPGTIAQGLSVSLHRNFAASFDLAPGTPPNGGVINPYTVFLLQIPNYSQAEFNFGSSSVLVNSPSLSVPAGEYGPVNIIGTDVEDILPYLGDETQLIDGGNAIFGDTGDVFIANFRHFHPDDAIRWDSREAQNGTDDLSLTLTDSNGNPHTLTVRSVESIVMATGDQDDYFTTTTAGYDFWLAGGGDDRLRNIGDTFDETFRLEDGDDAVAVELSPSAFGAIDEIDGGAGFDEALIDAGFFGTRIEVARSDRTPFAHLPGFQVVERSINPNNADTQTLFGYGAQDSTADLLGITELFYLEANVSDPNRLERGGGVDAEPLVRIFSADQAINSFAFGAVDLADDFEAISYRGDDVQPGALSGDDFHIFYGGALNRGGANPGGLGGVDTFAADFSRFEAITVVGTIDGVEMTVTDLELGVVLSADQQRLASDGVVFGNSEVSGYERLIVTGTSFDDRLVGGDFNDVLIGGDGDDVLEGGGASSSDGNILAGGAGGDFFIHEAGEVTYLTGDIGGSVINGLDLEITGPEQTLAGHDRLLVRPGEGFATTGSSFLRMFLSDNGGASFLQFDATSTVAELHNAQAIADTTDTRGFNYGAGGVIAQRIESSIQEGTDAHDDLLFYDNGPIYVGGERAGDADHFYADFRDAFIDLEFVITDDEAPGTLQRLTNGVTVSGVDRATIRFGEGNDIARGGALDDHFEGNDGDDRFAGGFGSDTLLGGAGEDLFFYAGGFLDADVVDGGADTDRLIISTQDADGNAIADGGLGFIVVGEMSAFIHNNSGLAAIEQALDVYDFGDTTRTFAGSSNVLTQNVELIEIEGADAFDDLVVYQGGIIYAGGERSGDADIFAANFTDETEDLRLDTRDDGEFGGSSAVFDIGNGVTIGEFERLVVKLGSGDDHATGGALSDLLDGGAGNDRLSGGLGNDEVRGGDGEDVISFQGGADLIDGGADFDVLDIGAQTTGFQLDLSAADIVLDASESRAAQVANLDGLFDQLPGEAEITLSSVAAAVTFQNIEFVNASGGDANDVLIAGSEGGVLDGGLGDDLMISREGQDILFGNEGTDTYVLGVGWGEDLIVGEIAGNNILHFEGFDDTDVAYGVNGDDLVISAVGGTDVLTVLGYFAVGGNGLDFDFRFENFAQDQKVDLTILGAAATVGGVETAGLSVNGTEGIDQFVVNDGTQDLAIGTSGADVYQARGGNDFLFGTLGGDVLNGAAGQDTAIYRFSETGVDVDLARGFGIGGEAEGDAYLGIEDLIGSEQDDVLMGNRGQNGISGGSGDDDIAGRGGNDFLGGGDGDDALSGDEGSDMLFGEAGIDAVEGGGGDDYLSGGEGDDSLLGGSGNDILNGGSGVNVLNGGVGNDRFVYDGELAEGSTDSVGIDNVIGGGGTDTADLSQSSEAVLIDLGAGIVQTEPEATPISSSAPRTLMTLSSVESAVGSAQNDRLLGNHRNNTLAGEQGDDLLVGGAGRDSYDGGGGIDTADFSAEGGAAGIFADLDSDRVTDSFGNSETIRNIEIVVGTGLADTFQGNSFANTFVGGAGNDSFNPFTPFDGTGFDTIDYSFSGGLQGLAVDVGAGSIDDDFGDVDSFVHISRIVGTAQVDQVVADGSSDELEFVGGEGADEITGAGRIHMRYDLEGGTSGVTVDLTAESATDTHGDSDILGGVTAVTGSLGDDEIDGSAEADRLSGSEGDDEINGRNGDDVINGGGGNDFILGGNGSDVIRAGAGNDRVIGQAGDDRMDGGEGIDILDYSGNIDDITVNLATGVTSIGAETAINFETVLVGSGDNEVTGTSGANIIRTGAGNDRLIGGAGIDLLDGGDDIDTAVYEGLRDDYDVIVFQRGGEAISAEIFGGVDSDDRLVEVEHAEFQDGAVDLAVTSEVDFSVATSAVVNGVEVLF